MTDKTTQTDSFAPVRRFRLFAVRTALMLTVVAALIAYRFDPVASKGLLLGGLAGILSFWVMATRLEKLASIPQRKVKFAALRWTALCLLLYGVVMYKAFTLDSERFHGLMGAVLGIFIIRFVQIFLGFTGIDLSPDEAEDGVEQRR